MILVDTNVWVSFFKGESKALPVRDAIIGNEIVLHPWVLGELLLGGLPARAETLLGSLETADIADHELVCDFIRKKSLKSRGIGWVDANLLVSALAGRHLLHTFDDNLQKVSRDFGCNAN